MKKRIFTAIDISAEARTKVANYIKNLQAEFPQIRVGWEKAEKLHLTLKFLGDIDEIQLQNLTKAAEKAARQTSNFSLQILNTGVFPSRRNAKILWLGLKNETGSLRNLQEIVENECEQIGFVKEKRNFKAHLTIARLREPHKSSILANVHVQNKFSSRCFNVRELVVIESRLSASGSQYTPLFRARFHKPDLPLTSF